MRPAQEDLVEVIRRSGITDERLIRAFREVPRAKFVPDHLVDAAYQDRPLRIPQDQVTTQPSLSARMMDVLELGEDSHVLEIGTGYGFQTALLAHLAAEVVSIERFAGLAERARIHLESQGIGNVDIRVGDGSLGAPDAAPFDAILVSAAFPRVPQPLQDQLAEGGRLVQPVGPGGNEMVMLYEKLDGVFRHVQNVVGASFVRLVGEEGFAE